jgi:DNA-binding NtrC family response regulator
MKLMVVSNPEDEISLEDKINCLTKLTHSLLSELKFLVVAQPDAITGNSNFYEEVRRFEIRLIERALVQCGGNQTNAAQMLGLKLTTLNTKIKRYRIDPRTYNTGIESIKESSTLKIYSKDNWQEAQSSKIKEGLILTQ